MASIAENLRATLLSLKQISDRVKSLILTSVTKSEANSAKQDVLDAIDEIDIDTSDLAKEGSVARIVSSKVPTVMECSYYPDVTFVRVGYDLGYYKWLRVDGYDMYLYTPSAIEIGVPCYSSINPQVEVGVVTFLKTVTLDGVAQESTLTQGVQDIREDISHIDIDTSSLAKQTRVKDGNDTAISVGKEIRSEVGTGSDTAAETGTLFAVVKWVKDKVKSIFNSIGTPAEGQPNTIFAAIAAIGGSDDSKQTIVNAINYMGGSATANMTWAQLAQQIEELQKIHDSNEVFIDNVSPLDYTMIFAISPKNSETKNILKVAYTEKTLSVYTYAFENCTNLEEVYMPNATYVGQLAFRNCTNIKKVNFMNAPDLYSDAFETLTKLIDLTTGAAFASNVSFRYWNPSEALKSNSSSLINAGEIFNNNLEKFLYNIREHFAANLTDRTGLTAYSITFHASVKAALLADQATQDAFTNKGWVIA